MPDSQLPSHIDLRVNEATSIVLPGSGVSGYAWQLHSDGDPAVAETAVRREQPPSSPTAVGRATPEILAIRAIAPGNLTLTLALRRPWERDAAPAQSHTITVTIS
jgi:predicted secreted protein